MHSSNSSPFNAPPLPSRENSASPHLHPPRPSRMDSSFGAAFGVDEPHGLAGAEKELLSLNLNAGQLHVQRQILQLRVDYLSQLNTQTMLLAGAAVGMLSSLELEAIGEAFEKVPAFQAVMISALYITFSSISLGSSIWVLYTSNELINLATMSVLHAHRLRDIQGADTVLSLRMGDVRRIYSLALLTLLPAIYIMVFNLIKWYVSLPAACIVLYAVLHAIHSDHATAYHFEKKSGIYLGSGFDYAIAECLHKANDKAVRCCARPRIPRWNEWCHDAYNAWTGDESPRYANLENRLQAAAHSSKKVEVNMHRLRRKGHLMRGVNNKATERRPKESLPRLTRPTQVAEASGSAYSGWLLKTPSSRGPIRMLETTAVGASREAHRLLVESTPAQTPSNKRWWRLEGGLLECFRSDEEWRASKQPLLTVKMREYTVIAAYDLNKVLTIALLPNVVLDFAAMPGEQANAEPHRSWYLCAVPPSDHVATRRWLEQLHLACECPTEPEES